MKDINWNQLEFNYSPTNCHIEYTFQDGQWDDGKIKDEPYLKINIAATALHYGQSTFEGLKAFRCKDGNIKIFREIENWKRINASAKYLMAPNIPQFIFQDAIERVIKKNCEFVPPYGTYGSLYLRPLYFGSGPTIGVNPSSEYKFIVFCVPVGPYYKNGLKAIDAIILDEYDRSAPKGAGCYKVAGNYAQTFTSSHIAKKQGYPITLFLDSKTHQYIDEFPSSNFIAITKNGTYITPDSKTILPSITNRSLMQLAKDMGINVERRSIHINELNDIAEVAACGTAVILTSISKIVRGDTVYSFGEECGPVFKKLYNKLQAIQYGEIEDTYTWLNAIEKGCVPPFT